MVNVIFCCAYPCEMSSHGASDTPHRSGNAEFQEPNPKFQIRSAQGETKVHDTRSPFLGARQAAVGVHHLDGDRLRADLNRRWQPGWQACQSLPTTREGLAGTAARRKTIADNHLRFGRASACQAVVYSEMIAHCWKNRLHCASTHTHGAVVSALFKG